MLIGVVIHELIHGLTALWYAKVKWEDIKFGLDAKTFTPYFHSKAPISAKKYRVVAVMPLVVMGLVPYFLALATGGLWLLAFGIMFTITAVGDVMILWLMRHLPADQQVQDHPTQVGLLVIDAEANLQPTP